VSVVAAAGCLALLARPLLWRDGADPTAALVLLFVVLGVVGVSWPTPPPFSVHRALPDDARCTENERMGRVLALALGLGAFVVARLVAGGGAARPLTGRVLALDALAAVAEEAFFRRFLFGALARVGGPVLAVGGSAVAFALVHVTVWGLWVLPVDLAAGLLLGWQRRASGTWTVPAVTHVVANVLAVV
jgi:membrane protease YdiL (CAAX protease family)